MTTEMKIERRNVYINKRRTTVAMEHYFWNMLDGICSSENQSVDEILTSIDNARGTSTKLTATIRYIINQTIKIQHAHETATPMEADSLAEASPPFPSAFYQAMENLDNEEQ